MFGGKWIKKKILSLCKLFFIFFTVIFLPKIFLLYTEPVKENVFPSHYNFKYGLENIPQQFVQILKGSKVAIVTNQTGKDQSGNRNIDLLKSRGFNIVKILTPEHGINGQVKAGKEINNEIDQKTKIPVVSLYGKGTFKEVNPRELKDIDTLIFDIQDSGMRHYTYISTLYKILDFSAKNKKRVIVLDRPNPLGTVMEGSLVEPEQISFISIAPIPLRYGMTIGEIAQFFNKHCIDKPANLIIISMKGYLRGDGILRKEFIELSPNIKNLDSCYGYSFLGILGEIKPFNVGIGTKEAFKCILLPEKISLNQQQWALFKKILQNSGIIATEFIYLNEKENKYYRGFKINIKNINEFSGFKTLIAILEFCKDNNIEIQYSDSFNKVIGTPLFKKYIVGEINKKKFREKINNDSDNFYKKAKDCFIYQPEPTLVKI